jgi:glycosyltransferase involved in cell wall biosynthesis
MCSVKTQATKLSSIGLSDMSERPLVSVVMPFLNAEKFVQESIESVLSQTLQKWELLMVDDGSSDGSSEIARRYVERHRERMAYLEHERHQNKGTSTSRNVGIQNAMGEYVAFLDADDIFLPKKLEEQAAILDSNPGVTFVCGRTEWWYSWTGKAEDAHRDFLQKLDVPLDTVVKPPTLLLMSLQDEWAALTADVTIRRSAILDVGGYQESFHDMHDDQAFHAKLCLGQSGFVSSTCWYRYRQHPLSTCHVASTSGQWSSARQTFLNWLETYLAERNIQNDKVWDLLRSEQKKLWHYRHPTLSRIRHRIGRAGNLMKRAGGGVIPIHFC